MFIRKVRRKEIIPNKRYAWLLYSGEKDNDPVDTVVLDVNTVEALAIDRDLGVAVEQNSKSSTPAGITVLLADDHAVLRQGLRALLEAENDIRVVGEAENGRQAVQMTKRIQPDVVLMDIAMPSLNGLEATRQINAQRLRSKVLILSCHGDEDYVQRSIDAGAVGYLIKQTSAHDLIRAIREARKGNAFFSPIISKRLLEYYCETIVKGIRVPRSRPFLTSRETEVLQLIAEGDGNKQIAAELGISIKTVEKHRQQVMNKLHIHEVAGLTRYAISKGMIPSGAKPEL